MFNLLHMDCRRLVKSRSFYITLSVVAVLIVLVNLLSVTISDPDFLDTMEAVGAEINEYDRQTSEFIRQMGQLDLAQEILGGGFLLLAQFLYLISQPGAFPGQVVHAHPGFLQPLGGGG